MLRDGFKHGFSEDQWIAAKEEARQAMIAVARSKSVITYSDLVRKITSCILEPNGIHLAHLLGEISSEEDEESWGFGTYYPLAAALPAYGQSHPHPGTGTTGTARHRMASPSRHP